jgi:hypothetical protein
MVVKASVRKRSILFSLSGNIVLFSLWKTLQPNVEDFFVIQK